MTTLRSLPSVALAVLVGVVVVLIAAGCDSRKCLHGHEEKEPACHCACINNVPQRRFYESTRFVCDEFAKAPVDGGAN